jgi:hypothetical protein
VTRAGFVAAVLQLVAAIFIPSFVVPIWFFLAVVTDIHPV